MERFPDGLDLRSDGSPGIALHRVELDGWDRASPAEIAAAAAAAAASPVLAVGVAEGALSPALDPLVQALTLTLSGPDCLRPGPACVVAPDPDDAFTRLADAVGARPRAAIALAQLLRQTEVLPTAPGLAAEAAVYSLLLGGQEFAAWLAGRPAPRVGPSAGDSADHRFPRVRTTRVGDRLTVVLDRPDRRNALSFAVRDELYDALEVAILDPSVTAVELGGTGPSFCSGGDLDEFGIATDHLAAYLVRIDRGPWRLLDRLRARLGPELTVRVQGAAVGAGAELAAFGGRVVCTPDAFFQLPEVSMGLVPGAGGTVSVTRRIGRHRAAWLMLTGARLDPRTAVDWGLADQIDEST